KNATARTNTPASISRTRSQSGLLFSINLRSFQAWLTRYLVAYLGVVHRRELHLEQAYQVSCQHCSNEGSSQYPCQAQNCSDVKRPIVRLVNLPFDSINDWKFAHNSFAERSISRSLNLAHDPTMAKSHHRYERRDLQPR